MLILLGMLASVAYAQIQIKPGQPQLDGIVSLTLVSPNQMELDVMVKGIKHTDTPLQKARKIKRQIDRVGNHTWTARVDRNGNITTYVRFNGLLRSVDKVKNWRDTTRDPTTFTALNAPRGVGTFDFGVAGDQASGVDATGSPSIAVIITQSGGCLAAINPGESATDVINDLSFQLALFGIYVQLTSSSSLELRVSGGDPSVLFLLTDTCLEVYGAGASGID